MARKNKKRGYAARAKEKENADIAHKLDNLADYEEYREKVAKWIRKDLNAGLNAKDIRSKYAAMVQARITSIALLDPDVGKALIAGKDHIDREEGKAKESKDITHRLEHVSDEELTSILTSSVNELMDMETDAEKH